MPNSPISKIKLPSNTTYDIHDVRVVSDAIAYIGDQQGSATYVDGGTIIDVTTKEDKSNKVTSLSSASTDTQYPSAKCVYDMIGDIETLLAAI